MKSPRSAILGLVLLLLPVPEATACTTFCLKRGSQAVFGKNYDWDVGDGLVIVNKRGVAKTAVLPPQDKAGPVGFQVWEPHLQPVRPRVPQRRHERGGARRGADVAR